MMKKTKLILLFMLVFTGSVLFGNTPVVAQDIFRLTGYEAGPFEGALVGPTIEEAYYCPLPGECIPMVQYATAYFMESEPTLNPDGTVVLPADYTTYLNSSLCVGEGSPGISWGGTNLWNCIYYLYSPPCLPAEDVRVGGFGCCK